MLYDIFISYRREGGKEWARSLKSELERRGYRVFLDFDELKDGVFDRRIMEAIDAAPIFIILLSPHALDRCVNENDWVRREIEYALLHGRHIVPINPEHSFMGFPPNISEELKKGLGQHQFSEVMFGQLFKESIDKMERERIEPLLMRIGRSIVQEQIGAIFHVETDLPCRILKFGEEICNVYPDKPAKIRLRKGRHKLEFISLECPDDRLPLLQIVEDNEMEDILTIELAPLREKRLTIARQAAIRIQIERGQVAYEAGNYHEAVLLWTEPARCGDSTAENCLGDCYYYGNGVEQNYTQAIKWYHKAANQGNTKAQYNLGWCYQNGFGVEKDYINALEWYRKAADQNDSTAQNSVGLCYYIGIGVKQNYVEAVKWYRKAANQQNSAAQNNLGWCYQEGLGIEKDCNEAVKWYRKAAEKGNSVAQDNLGDSYYIGRGNRQNYNEAAKWYRMAAEQGNRTAQNSLGNCYYYGNGVEQNYIEAVRWYRQAAEQGLCNAQNNLADCYFNGKGIIRDYVEAVKWYRMAAEQGYSNAQNNLGYCYYNGKGVVRDYAEAIKWYRKAASRGSESAKRMLERLGE